MDMKWLAIAMIGIALAGSIGGGLASYNKKDCWKFDSATKTTWNSCTGETK